jgi:DNA-binding MarR family transcriptional regulator
MAPNNVDAAKTAVELATAITRLRARLRSESSRQMTGWSISQLSILARVISAGPITASAIAQAEHMRGPSIAEVVPVLKRAGLVTTKPDPNDGRKVLITATVKGRRLRDTVAASREAWLAQAIETVLDAAEGETLTVAIELINRLADSRPPDADVGWRS